MSNTVICITGFDKQTISKYETYATKLGLKIGNIAKMDFLVAGCGNTNTRPNPTFKVLIAILKNIPIVKVKFLEDSYKKQRILDFHQYLCSYRKTWRKSLFKGYNVMFSQTKISNKLKALIRIGGGEILALDETSSKKRILICSSDTTYDEAQQLHMQYNCRIIDELWIINSIFDSGNYIVHNGSYRSISAPLPLNKFDIIFQAENKGTIAIIPTCKFGTNCPHFSWKGTRSFIETTVRPFHTEDMSEEIVAPICNPGEWHVLCSNCCMEILIATNNFKWIFDHFEGAIASEIYHGDGRSVLMAQMYFSPMLISLLKRPQIIKYFYTNHVNHDSFLYLFDELLLIYHQWSNRYADLSDKPDVWPIKNFCEELWNILCIVFNNYVTVKNLKFILKNDDFNHFIKHFMKPCFLKKEMNDICKYIEQFKYIRYNEKMKYGMQQTLKEYQLVQNCEYAPISIHILILLYKIYQKHNGNLPHSVTFSLTNKDKKRLNYLMVRLNAVQNRVDECDGSSISMWKCFMLKNMKDNVRCNNPKCNRDYIQYRYGDKYNLSVLSIQQVLDTKKNVMKKCKGCKMVFYCNKRCQKYDWNRFDHKKLCLEFRD
eukprot:478386_1